MDDFVSDYPSITEYMRYRGSLYIVDGAVMYNDRVVIPAALRNYALKTLHS